jgi:predicted P-loop ATPase
MRNDKGVPLGNLANVLLALRTAPEWQGVLGYDEFHARAVTLNPPPWNASAGKAWTDLEDTLATHWFQLQGIPVQHGIVGRGIQAAARENPFHPVRDYLDQLQWDGKSRLDAWLAIYLGVADSDYARAVGPRYLISAVARVFEPGCQADHVLILEGPQGRLKSSALRALAYPWFTDRLSYLGSKDAALELRGAWIVEMSELDALTRASTSAIKWFVTRRHDRFRPPYGKHVADHPRQCVFAGTINPQGGYLKDPTGARRFWPAACGTILLNELERDRNQLWAEALIRFKAGARWFLETPVLDALATAEQSARFASDAWEERVSEWLGDRADVSLGEVLIGALGIPQESWSQNTQNRVVNIIANMGFVKYRAGKPESVQKVG